MNRDDIIRMAREAGISLRGYYEVSGDPPPELERFAAIVIENFLQQSGEYLTNDASRKAAIKEAVEAEREECAKAAEGWSCEAAGDNYQTSGIDEFWDANTLYDQGRVDAAAAIRARGQA